MFGSLNSIYLYFVVDLFLATIYIVGSLDNIDLYSGLFLAMIYMFCSLKWIDLCVVCDLFLATIYIVWRPKQYRSIFLFGSVFSAVN